MNFEQETKLAAALKTLEDAMDFEWLEGYEIVETMSEPLRDFLQTAIYAVAMNNDAHTPELDFE